MRKLISFLGKGPYQPTLYVGPDGKRCETELVQEALVEFYQPEVVCILLTDEVRASDWWKWLSKRLSGRIDLRPVEGVPKAQRPEELWTLFELLTGCIERGDEVLFDITYAFRSLPVLALIAALYLQLTREVEIRHLVYAPYDPGQPETPIVELTPFLELLDWMKATDLFLHSGDSQRLARLLQESQDRAYRQPAMPEREDLPKTLKKLGGKLETLSAALRLARPREVLPGAAQATAALAGAEEEVRRWAPPFALLLERVRESYAPFALPGESATLSAESLAAQYRLIRWYLEHRQVLQAVSLAREWAVSAVLLRSDPERWLTRRDEAERTLNELAREKRQAEARGEARDEARDEAPPPLRLDLGDAERNALVDLWCALADLRNDLMHCGMRLQPTPVDRILPCVDKLACNIEQTARAFGLEPASSDPQPEIADESE